MAAQSIPIECDADRLKRVVVFGNGMLPLYRHGDLLLVSETAPLKIGDRVVLKTCEQVVLAGMLIHRDDKRVVLGIGGNIKRSLGIENLDVDFLGRIVWASQ